MSSDQAGPNGAEKRRLSPAAYRELQPGETYEPYVRADIFGVDLYAVGLGEQIEGMVKELYAGNGAVRKTLHKYVVAR